MNILTAKPLFHAQNILGEGPLWHPLKNRLFWVDIITGDLYQSDEGLESFSKTHFDCQIGAFGFRKEGGFIFATDQGFALWDEGQPEPDFFWNPLPTDRKNVRLNDGKVDPGGRFWAGSLDTELIQGELSAGPGWLAAHPFAQSWYFQRPRLEPGSQADVHHRFVLNTLFTPSITTLCRQYHQPTRICQTAQGRDRNRPRWFMCGCRRMCLERTLEWVACGAL